MNCKHVVCGLYHLRNKLHEAVELQPMEEGYPYYTEEEAASEIADEMHADYKSVHDALTSCNRSMDIFMERLLGEKLVARIKKREYVTEDWEFTHTGLKYAHELGCF